MNIKRFINLIFAVVITTSTVALTPASAVLRDAESDRLIEMINRSWDLSQNPHRFAAFLVLRQADNPYPGYFAGSNTSGTLELSAEHDALLGDLVIEGKTDAEIRLLHGPLKLGMEQQVPGGVWVANLREQPCVVQLTGLSDLSLAEPQKRGQPTRALQGKATGRLFVDPKQAADFTSELRIDFDDKLPAIRLTLRFEFAGEDVGLTGGPAGIIDATLHTVTTPSRQRPPDLMGR